MAAVAENRTDVARWGPTGPLNGGTCSQLEGQIVQAEWYGCDLYVQLEDCKPLYFRGTFIKCDCERDYIGYSNADELVWWQELCCDSIVETGTPREDTCVD